MAYYIQSQRGGRKLVDANNYIYRIQGKNADKSKLYWRCEVPGCQARAQSLVYGEPDISIVTTGEHCHIADIGKIEMSQVVGAIEESVYKCEPGLIAHHHGSSLQTHFLAALMPTTAKVGLYYKDKKICFFLFSTFIFLIGKFLV